MHNSLNILSESLDKKIELLKRIVEYDEEQEKFLNSAPADFTSFDKDVERKGELIDELNRLDNGFEVLYNKIARQLEENKDNYKEQIADLQEKIRIITDLTITIQSQEQRNKALIEKFFAKSRQDIKKGRLSGKAALNYYKTMSGSGSGEPGIMDSKK
ncbi:MAG: flagellar protein FlgN [Acetatifactor sp.]|nr:flagellar protein FlgN [Acetatifactor sp.]